jgi:N-acetyl-gamma-glutamyl-phosphate reductase
MNHENVNLSGISSENNQGAAFSSLYPSFKGQYDAQFESNQEVISKSDVVFICLPHGKSEGMVKQCMDEGKKVIDAGADFRLDDLKLYEDWYETAISYPDLHDKAVYGLPEMNKEAISKTSLVANPGCYPTSILLGLYPAVSEHLIDMDTLIIDAKSGVTGAGKSLSAVTHFANKNEAFKAYKAGTHRHTPEIEEKLSLMGADKVKVSFVPHLLPVNRGILSTMYADLKNQTAPEIIHELYKDWYADDPFVTVLDYGDLPDISHVTHSNQCHIGLTVDERTQRLIIVSVIDNMQKGAAGQAVQNMNIMMGFNETEGLAMAAPSF